MSYFIRSKNVIIRKQHICWGCGEKFDAGTKMMVTTEADEGSIGTFYWCKRCEEVISKMDHEERQDGLCLGDLKEFHTELIKHEGNQ